MPRCEEFLITDREIRQRRVLRLQWVNIGAAMLAAVVAINETGSMLWRRSALAVHEHTTGPMIAWFRSANASAPSTTPSETPWLDRQDELLPLPAQEQIHLAGIEPEEPDPPREPTIRFSRWTSPSKPRDNDAPAADAPQEPHLAPTLRVATGEAARLGDRPSVRQRLAPAEASALTDSLGD